MADTGINFSGKRALVTGGGRGTYRTCIGNHARFWYFWVRCTINRPHSTPCKKAEFVHLHFFQDIMVLGYFSACEWQDLSFAFQNVKRQPTLIILFSQQSPFFEGE